MDDREQLLDALEDMCIQHCHTDKDGLTDSMALSANAYALESLAEHGRFRITRSHGRRVQGYFPAFDNSSQNTDDGGPHGR